jgi:hypothetical protein
MPKGKDFDCLEMKNRIQAELLEHYRGMTDEEIREDQLRRIEANPILGPFYRRITGKEAVSDEPVK